MMERGRNNSQFQKGMTLEDYIRGMDLRQSNIPTADTNNFAQQNEECLYKTSHAFYNPPKNGNVSAIKQIEEENFEDSLDQHRQTFNIASTYFQKAGKQHPVAASQHKKIYRIRNGRSMSPYAQITRQQNLTPQKNVIKKFAKLQEFLPKQYNIERIHQPSPILNTLKKHHRGSNKKLTHQIPPAMTRMHQTGANWKVNQNSHYIKGFEKIDMRVQKFKQRFDTKKKNKKNK